MTEDSMPQSTNSSSKSKPRKKSKWDQPAESLVSAGIVVPGVHPLGNMGAFIGAGHPGVAAPVSTASMMNNVAASYGHLQHVPLAPLMQQHAAALAQKIQPQIQEELIAREIVINDAESSVRYRLTKRQTQDEIQKSTGANVITRGKYRPPNGPSDGEKPLYLHVSAGTHLETTADRIKAVDQAAAMVEDILKQGPVANGLKVVQPFSTCVFLGFEPNPTLNITARIRGPNDQYVNHIMNETGSTVLLKGRGSGISASIIAEEQQPLHLFLSSSNPKSLEHAKLLAENLLDTICAECGASRVSSVKVYGAVAPPHQLLAGVQSTAVVSENTTKVIATSASLTADYIQSPVTSLVTSPGTTTVTNGRSLPDVPFHPQSSLSHGTSYNGYGGIYPQATPLQQVALALRQSTSPITSTVSATQKAGNTVASTISEKEKRPPHKRKFQELPASTEGPLIANQESVILKPSEVKSYMPAPVKLVPPSSNGMMPPPPRAMPPPPPRRTVPPPPRFDSSTVTKALKVNSASKSEETKSVPDTLISLMEYGDDDDDDIEETTEEPITKSSKSLPASKPFWAVLSNLLWPPADYRASQPIAHSFQ
uniref:Protein RIK n=1 Tax=Tanacetum cinerariifolium TaxID=118510 RepID=A0A699GYF3_TANCI|nr:protein RIK isoform X1 [Tanacetum cinerariifolium]